MRESIRSRAGPRLSALAGAGSSGALLLAAVVVACSPVTGPIDASEVRAIVERHLEAQNEIMILPEGVRAGHLSEAQRLALRTRISDAFVGLYADDELTRQLNNVLAWADRVARDPAAGQVFEFRVEDVSVAKITGGPDAVTAEGTTAIRSKGGHDTAEGVLVTLGGTYRRSFTLQLSRRGDAWLITRYRAEGDQFERDPAFESNLDYVPAGPRETKPPRDDSAPMPMDPTSGGPEVPAGT
jgi:hypothetical protein